MTAAERALNRIVSLCSLADNITGREVRIYEISMEGLMLPPAERRANVERLVQKRRDAIAARREAKEAADANS